MINESAGGTWPEFSSGFLVAYNAPVFDGVQFGASGPPTL